MIYLQMTTANTEAGVAELVYYNPDNNCIIISVKILGQESMFLSDFTCGYLPAHCCLVQHQANKDDSALLKSGTKDRRIAAKTKTSWKVHSISLSVCKWSNNLRSENSNTKQSWDYIPIYINSKHTEATEYGQLARIGNKRALGAPIILHHIV